MDFNRVCRFLSPCVLQIIYPKLGVAILKHKEPCNRNFTVVLRESFAQFAVILWNLIFLNIYESRVYKFDWRYQEISNAKLEQTLK